MDINVKHIACNSLSWMIAHIQKERAKVVSCFIYLILGNLMIT